MPGIVPAWRSCPAIPPRPSRPRACPIVTINLNADYEGGDLRFPEYGARTCRPPPGGACVFSCSILHEATPVTRGERFAFLPFLYDEAAAKVREENLKYLDPALTA